MQYVYQARGRQRMPHVRLKCVHNFHHYNHCRCHHSSLTRTTYIILYIRTGIAFVLPTIIYPHKFAVYAAMINLLSGHTWSIYLPNIFKHMSPARIFLSLLYVDVIRVININLISIYQQYNVLNSLKICDCTKIKL